MRKLRRSDAFTSQMLGFAQAQLTLLGKDLNIFQQRVVKQAFLFQAVNALLSYLEELAVFDVSELPLVNLKAFLDAHLDREQLDYRVREIKNLLNPESSEDWLLRLLQLYEASQHTARIERKHQPEEEPDGAAGNLIVAVAAEERQTLWWEHEREELAALFSQLEKLIARQREDAFEA